MLIEGEDSVQWLVVGGDEEGDRILVEVVVDVVVGVEDSLEEGMPKWLVGQKEGRL